MSHVVNSTSIDDTSSNITYSGGAWTFVPDAQLYKNLYDNTETYSGETGATATLHFYGDALEYWGNTWNDHGPCDLVLDSMFMTTITAYTAAPSGGPPMILFSTNNLTLGDHTFQLQVTGTNPNASNCEIDRFVVNITSSASNGRFINQPKPSTPIGAIVGGIIGCVILLCILAFLLFWRRNRRASREERQNLLISTPLTIMEMQRQAGYYDDAHPSTQHPYNALYYPAPTSFSAPPTASTSAFTSIGTSANTSARHLPPEKAAYRRGEPSSGSGSTNPTTSVAPTNRVPEPAEDPPAYE